MSNVILTGRNGILISFDPMTGIGYVEPANGIVNTFNGRSNNVILLTSDLPIATSGTVGAVKPDNSTITISNGVLTAISTGGVDTVNGRGGAVTLVSGDIPLATSSYHGIVKPDNSTITIDGTGTLTGVVSGEAGVTTINGRTGIVTLVSGDIPLATSSYHGIVKPDNSTITIDGTGRISATISGGSSVTSVNGRNGAVILVSGDIPLATSSYHGIVKPDNSTITISNGVLSSTGGTSSGNTQVGPHPLTSILSLRSSNMYPYAREMGTFDSPNNNLMYATGFINNSTAVGTNVTYDSTSKKWYNGLAPASLVPNMTSATSPSGTVSASSYYSTADPYKAFDGITPPGTYGWLNTGSLPSWVRYDFDGGTQYTVTKYRMWPWSTDNFPARSPKDWTFEGSNDGSSWTTLDTQTNFTPGSAKFYDFTFSNTQTFSKYRINISANNGNTYTGIEEFQIWGIAAGSSSQSLTGSPYVESPVSNPTTLYLSALIGSWFGSGITNIVPSVSRDYGSTWVSGAFNYAATLGGYYYLLDTGPISVSGVGNPTLGLLKWKIDISSGDCPDFFGVSLRTYPCNP